MDEAKGLFQGVAGDGRPLLSVTALALLYSGAFALFLSITGQFLPHDVQYLEFTAAALCEYADCRIVAFMFHDRVAFGGALMSIGTMYLWLVSFPLRRGEAWAWWTFALSGSFGFLSFLAYLGYGYLDTWHGMGTVFLLPCFIAGLALSYRTLNGPRAVSALFQRAALQPVSRQGRAGRLLLLGTAGGMVAGGLTILVVGMTSVFVPQDLEFMRLGREELTGITARLIPLIAHDRAGFGGGLASSGLIVGLSVYHGRSYRSLWQALLIAGIAGFGCAIGVHIVVGYTDLWHLAPAVAGAGMFAAGTWLSRGMLRGVP